MRIGDYRNALSGLNNKDLDELVVYASKTAIRFERPTAPPGHWRHAQGSLVNAPTRTTPADGETPLSRRQFLSGFMADLSREFGPGIAMECLQNYCPKDGKPITARTVKVVIDQAEWQRTLTCRANDCIISASFDQRQWDDKNPSNQDPTDAGHPPLPGIETLEIHAEKFVRSQLIYECRKAPEYSKKALDDLAASRLFNKVLNDVLRQYEVLRQLPMMTAQALEMTFARLNESAEKIGFEQTLAQLPVHAAKACLYCSLDPNVPDSLMAQAVRRIQGDAPNAPFPETVLAIVVHDFRERFEMLAPGNANADPNLSDDTFAQTIVLGTQLLDELLGNFLRWQAAIDTAPEFSPRQKMTMTRLLGEGRLNDAEIAACRSIADAMRHAFAPDVLAALTSTEAAAQYLAGQLCRLADELVDRMILVDTGWREQSASARLDTPSFQRAIRNFSEPRIALGVFGFTLDEAKALAGHLAGTTAELIAKILEKRRLYRY